MDRQRGINSIHIIIIIVFARVAAIGHPSRRRCTLTTNPQTRQQWFGIPSWQVNYWLVNGMVGTTSVEGVLFLLTTCGAVLVFSSCRAQASPLDTYHWNPESVATSQRMLHYKHMAQAFGIRLR